MFEETINHNGTFCELLRLLLLPLVILFVILGAPFRIALAFGDSDFQYVLLDHIPHWDSNVSPKFYKFNINIPDVNCEKCALQIVNPMTDKLSTDSYVV